MQAAAELLFSEQKSNASWLVNRLVAIAHEDIGIANPPAVMFVNSTVPHIRDLLKENKRDRAGLLIGNCILVLCRGPKSRLGDHFQCAAGKPVKLGIEPYAIPDYAHDKHTHKGRSAGKDCSTSGMNLQSWSRANGLAWKIPTSMTLTAGGPGWKSTDPSDQLKAVSQNSLRMIDPSASDQHGATTSTVARRSAIAGILPEFWFGED